MAIAVTLENQKFANQLRLCCKKCIIIVAPLSSEQLIPWSLQRKFRMRCEHRERRYGSRDLRPRGRSSLPTVADPAVSHNASWYRSSLDSDIHPQSSESLARQFDTRGIIFRAPPNAWLESYFVSPSVPSLYVGHITLFTHRSDCAASMTWNRREIHATEPMGNIAS